MILIAYTSLSVLVTAISLGTVYNSHNDVTEMIKHIVKSKLIILVLVNLAYNVLFLLGKLLQVALFGRLRDIEAKNIYDRLLQYILLKIVFVAAVNLEPNFADLLAWVAWFSIIGFMKVFSLLARDRFEHITTINPNSGTSEHKRMLGLLVSILVCDIGWFYFCYSAYKVDGASMVLLLVFESFTLFLDTCQTIIKYIIYSIDISREQRWEQRDTYIYYTEFFTDTLILVATLGHYIQIFLLHGLSFTLIDAILFLHMRLVFNSLREKISSYRNFRVPLKEGNNE